MNDLKIDFDELRKIQDEYNKQREKERTQLMNEVVKHAGRWGLKQISKGQMPPANQYVLIFVPDSPWIDSSDQYGVFWKVAKCVYGISAEDRKKLAESDNPTERERAKRFYPEDEQGNNEKPYRFKEFGPGSFFGQEVDLWCELPGRNIERSGEDAVD